MSFADTRFETQTPDYPTWCCHFYEEILAHYTDTGVSPKKEANTTTNNPTVDGFKFQFQVLIGIFK